MILIYIYIYIYISIPIPTKGGEAGSKEQAQGSSREDQGGGTKQVSLSMKYF